VKELSLDKDDADREDESKDTKGAIKKRCTISMTSLACSLRPICSLMIDKRANDRSEMRISDRTTPQ